MRQTTWNSTAASIMITCHGTMSIVERILPNSKAFRKPQTLCQLQQITVSLSSRHEGTHDMIIRNNTVYDNNGSGIICSLNCYNILIENNKVHHNAEDGIDFSRNMYNSIARNNIVYDEAKGIFVSRSHSNQIYNNTVSTSGDGINVNSGSTNNKMYDNTLMNSKSHAILITNGSTGNTFYSDKIVSANKQGLDIDQDSTSKTNTFSNNQIINSAVPNNTITNPIHKKIMSQTSDKGE